MENFVLFYFVFVSLISQQSLAKTYLIKQTCEKASSKELCHSVFAAHPDSKNADLKGLADIAIEATIKQAKIIRTKLKSLPAVPGHKETTKALDDCFNLYEQAIAAFGKSKKDLDSKKYTTFSIWALVAMTAGHTCEDGFAEIRGGFHAATPLTKMNRKYDDLCSIILAVTTELSGDHKA